MSKSLKAINLPIISTSTCLHFALYDVRWYRILNWEINCTLSA